MKCEYTFVEDSPGKRPCGRPKHKWVDNINIDFKRKESHGMDLVIYGLFNDTVKIADYIVSNDRIING
jgi:hypothetical protein